MPPRYSDKDGGQKKPSRRKGIGFIQRISVARQERLERRSEQSWIAKKLAVGIAIALVGYTTYVYVRMCVPMIRRRSLALGSRAEGGAFIHLYVSSSCLIIFVSRGDRCAWVWNGRWNSWITVRILYIELDVLVDISQGMYLSHRYYCSA